MSFQRLLSSESSFIGDFSRDGSNSCTDRLPVRPTLAERFSRSGIKCSRRQARSFVLLRVPIRLPGFVQLQAGVAFLADRLLIVRELQGLFLVLGRLGEIPRLGIRSRQRVKTAA